MCVKIKQSVSVPVLYSLFQFQDVVFIDGSYEVVFSSSWTMSTTLMTCSYLMNSVMATFFSSLVVLGVNA